MDSLDSQTKLFEQWLLTTQGQVLFHEEQKQTTLFLSKFPYLKTIIQLGGHSFLTQPCTNTYQYIYTNHHINTESNSVQTVSSFMHLPFESGQIDAIICPHIQELMVEPTRLYAEIKRVLKPNGFCLIFGLHPISLWRTQMMIHNQFNFPWKHYYHTMMSLKNQLANKALCPIQSQSFMYQPMAGHLNKKLFFDSLGQFIPTYLSNAYLIIAQKKDIPLTPKPLYHAKKECIIPA